MYCYLGYVTELLNCTRNEVVNVDRSSSGNP